MSRNKGISLERCGDRHPSIYPSRHMRWTPPRGDSEWSMPHGAEQLLPCATKHIWRKFQEIKMKFSEDCETAWCWGSRWVLGWVFRKHPPRQEPFIHRGSLCVKVDVGGFCTQSPNAKTFDSRVQKVDVGGFCTQSPKWNAEKKKSQNDQSRRH